MHNSFYAVRITTGKSVSRYILNSCHVNLADDVERRYPNAYAQGSKTETLLLGSGEPLVSVKAGRYVPTRWFHTEAQASSYRAGYAGLDSSKLDDLNWLGAMDAEHEAAVRSDNYLDAPERAEREEC